MASSNFHRRTGEDDFYPTAPYTSRTGLKQRPAAASSDSGHISLQMDALESGFHGEEIAGLRKKVGQLKHVAQDIQTEVKFQKSFINKLQMILTKAQGGMMNNMNSMSRTIIKEGSNHIVPVILFALIFFSLVFLWFKFLRK